MRSREGTAKINEETLLIKPNYQEALASRGHEELVELDSIELLREVSKWGSEEYGNRCTTLLRRLAMIHSILPEQLPPLVVRNEQGKYIQNRSTRAILAMAFVLKEMGIESYFCCTGGTAKEITYQGKPWSKRRTDINGQLSEKDAEIFDTDFMLIVNPETLPTDFSLDNVIDKANELLNKESDFKLRKKTSCWRGQENTWIDFGSTNPESDNWDSFGHVFFPKNKGRYGADKDFIRCLAEDEDLKRYVLLILPMFKDVQSFEEIEEDYLPSGVEIDIWWKHRHYRSISFYQGKALRWARPAITHLPEFNDGNLIEYWYWLCRPRDLSSNNAFRVFFGKKNMPAYDEVLFSGIGNPIFDQFIMKEAFQTSLWIRQNVYLPALRQLQDDIFWEKIINDGYSQKAESVTRFLLGNLAGAVNPDPYLGIQHLLSPQDNRYFKTPVFGPGYLELYFPKVYALLKANLPELKKEVENWDWGMGKVGAKKLLEFMLCRLEEDRDALRDTLTSIFAENDFHLTPVIENWISGILGKPPLPVLAKSSVTNPGFPA